MTTREQQPASVAAPCLDIFEGMTTHAVVERYRNGLVALDPRVLELTDDQADRWFDAEEGVGLWSARALLTHLMDAETLYTMRFRRTLAEENPVFENWDEDAFIGSRLSRPGPDALLMPTGACVATIHTLRQTMGTVLVQLSEDDWERRAMNPYLGEVTLLHMVRYAAWHLERHAAFVNAKVHLMLGPATEDDGAFQGCGEGCGCVGDKAGNESTN